MSSNSIKSTLLGMPFGTANGRLNKLLMFSLVKRLEMDCCHRCGKQIESAKELSIEHKNEWQRAADPVAAFFDLENISFSHLLCNIKAGIKPNKRFANRKECDAFNDRKNRAANIIRKQKRRDRLRAAGLPYH